VNTPTEIKEATDVTMASNEKIVIFAQGLALEKTINILLENGWGIDSGHYVVLTLCTNQSLNTRE
jgi:hypothetical protein